MEEKILSILLEIQQDVKVLKEDNKYIKGELSIMKNNIDKILEVQNDMNENFKKHQRQARIKYKEIDYRLAKLEA